MRENKVFKIVVFVPETHADVVRQVIEEAGAGTIGNYSHCSFSIKGLGRFKPLAGAHPAVGEVGRLEEVKEERIEFICPENLVKKVTTAIRKVHPYEEVALDIYPLVNSKNE